MDIRAMHYDFKQKLNKIDSQQYKNLRVPEIDWKINEAVDIFIKLVAQPRIKNHLGFETSQRSIDDLRTIVVDEAVLALANNADGTYTGTIPTDYQFYSSAEMTISKTDCTAKTARAIQIQHDDRDQESPFDKSSFNWGEVNVRFYEDGIKIFTDSTFAVDEFRLDYIKKHLYIHNAQDFLPGATYNLPDGTVLAGSQDCVLPEHTHREIVDIAVLIATGELQMPDYQIKQNKLNLNQIN